MDLPNRKLPRLKDYDYSAYNYYYITICTANKHNLFWNHQGLSAFGRIVKEELEGIAGHYSAVTLDKHAIMPNHIHAIIVIGSNAEEKKNPTLSTVIGSFKSGVSRRFHKIDSSLTVWQKSFYDSVIRNDQMYGEIWRYIEENPIKWELNEH